MDVKFHGNVLIIRAHKLVGARCARPRSCESNFAFGKSQRLLRRSLHVVQVLSVPLCCTPKTSSRGEPLAQDDVSERYLR